MIQLNRDLTPEEQAAIFQAMTVEQLRAIERVPVQLNWTEAGLTASYEDEEEEPAHLSILQGMTPSEVDNFVQLTRMSIDEKMEKTRLSQATIELIESDANQAVYGDILRYCKRLGIPKALFLEDILEEEMV